MKRLPKTAERNRRRRLMGPDSAIFDQVLPPESQISEAQAERIKVHYAADEQLAARYVRKRVDEPTDILAALGLIQ